ncbi:PL29 family lyase N-terminal domain-containing protein [Bacteroides eggerthii]|uniref:PL29 family lyase N-terminal domain-containing protein n=1 Tax=Bacteroides eggerthii TaxID=28111 RepID=UPI003564BCED
MKRSLCKKSTIKKSVLYCLTAFFSLSFSSCNDNYDDSTLRSDIENIAERVAALEAWQKSVNADIKSLQSLVAALESKNLITGVIPLIEGTEEIGYTITFQTGNPVTIKHGKTGLNGDSGITPQIGAAKDEDNPADETYYWTVKIGDGEPEFILDKQGNKLSVTGEKGEEGISGHTPVLSVAEDNGVLYWKVDGEWLLNDNKKVPSTGEPGDAIFDKDGCDFENPTCVTFKLKDGTTLTMPRVRTLTVGFESYDVLVTSGNETVKIVLPDNLQKDDYTALVAELKNEDGTTDMDVATRATDVLAVEIVEPTFTEDKYNGDAAVKINKTATNGMHAILKVTLIDNSGTEISVSRVLEFAAVADNTESFESAINIEGSKIHLDNSISYTMPGAVAKGVSIEGNGATITIPLDQELTADGVTIANVTLQSDATSQSLKKGILKVSGNVTFDNVQMTQTTTEYGIWVAPNATVTVKNSTFDATRGSRAIFSQGNVTLENCDFSANLTYAYNGNNVLTAKGCTFRGWMSGWHGGGVFENCTFDYGDMYYPVAVCYGDTEFRNCVFKSYGNNLTQEDGSLNAPLDGTKYGYDYCVGAGSAINITFTGCTYWLNGTASPVDTNIFQRGWGDGKTNAITVNIEGTEYLGDSDEFREAK